ncbi:hypothetical protein ACJX0J_039793 [Zea mays]
MQYYFSTSISVTALSTIYSSAGTKVHISLFTALSRNFFLGFFELNMHFAKRTNAGHHLPLTVPVYRWLCAAGVVIARYIYICPLGTPTPNPVPPAKMTPISTNMNHDLRNQILPYILEAINNAGEWIPHFGLWVVDVKLLEKGRQSTYTWQNTNYFEQIQDAKLIKLPLSKKIIMTYLALHNFIYDNNLRDKECERYGADEEYLIRWIPFIIG